MKYFMSIIGSPTKSALNTTKKKMEKIPPDILNEILADPIYTACLRQIYFRDHECQGRITFEHAIKWQGRRLNTVWAIIPICEYAHSVGIYQNNGILNKEKNVFLALSRAPEEELKKYSKGIDYIKLKNYLKEKFEAERG